MRHGACAHQMRAECVYIGHLDIYISMPKLLVSLPTDVSERLREVTHKKGDISRFVTEAVRYRLALRDKEELKKLRDMKEKVVSLYNEKKFGRMVTAQGHFSVDGADIQLSVDATMREEMLDKFQQQEKREARRDHRPVFELQLDENAERRLYKRIGDIRDRVFEWAENGLEQKHWDVDKIAIAFDPETNLRFCAACGFPAKEFNECLECGATC